ncbi:MAG: carbohydrate kinase family protein [Candidatus Dependentiae bacterium]|jgi:sugar/nucleoside kinase (ribokinase family)
MKNSLLVVGGATQDIFMTLPCPTLVPDGKNSATALQYCTGGGGSNAAVSFARQGFTTSLVAMVGNDEAGKMVKAELEKEGVDTSLLQVHKSLPTAMSVVLQTPGQQSTIVAYRGATTGLQFNGQPGKSQDPFNSLYITSLSNDAARLLPTITSTLRPQCNLIACNPGESQLRGAGIQYLYESLPHIDVLILNAREASFLRNAPDLLAHGPQIVIITDGAHGVHAYTKDKTFYQPSLATEVVDTLGAGDAFGSAFVGALISSSHHPGSTPPSSRTWSRTCIQDALATGCANSAGVLQHIGGKMGLQQKR